jgi:hypothetical protein
MITIHGGSERKKSRLYKYFMSTPIKISSCKHKRDPCHAILLNWKKTVSHKEHQTMTTTYRPGHLVPNACLPLYISLFLDSWALPWQQTSIVKDCNPIRLVFKGTLFAKKVPNLHHLWICQQPNWVNRKLWSPLNNQTKRKEIT